MDNFDQLHNCKHKLEMREHYCDAECRIEFEYTKAEIARLKKELAEAKRDLMKYAVDVCPEKDRELAALKAVIENKDGLIRQAIDQGWTTTQKGLLHAALSLTPDSVKADAARETP